MISAEIRSNGRAIVLFSGFRPFELSRLLFALFDLRTRSYRETQHHSTATQRKNERTRLGETALR